VSRPERRAVVVGGGVLGTWHALELVEAGFAVDHLDAELVPHGASVRNFGLVWVSGRRDGEELDCARRGRRRWEEIAAAVPDIGFRPAGSLTVARTHAERAVMVAFAAHPAAAAREVTFLGPDEARDCNPALKGELAGALHCRADAAVEPRRVLGALREHLAHAGRVDRGQYRFHPGRHVVAAEPRAVLDAAGTRWTGDLVVLATGAAFDVVPALGGTTEGLQRVRLQMLETAPFPERLTTALADADTLRYYPAYEVAPRDELGAADACAAAHHLQLLVVQRPGGGLTIGDTHCYDEPFDFALPEEPATELLARARRILGRDLPPVERRWAGVYAQCRDGAVCHREEVRPGVFWVTGPGGRGMTCAPAIAADTLRVAEVTT
jgi:FAD dependent oxidoreductase TIGR03364